MVPLPTTNKPTILAASYAMQFWILLWTTTVLSTGVDAFRFVARHNSFSTRKNRRPSTQIFVCTVRGARQGIELPLLDVLGNDSNKDSTNDYQDAFVQPLPSTHLPDEMTTLHVYGLTLNVPLHQSIVQYALDHPILDEYDGGQVIPTIGHVAWKPTSSSSSSSVEGAIGCAAQILMPSATLALSSDKNDPTNQPAPSTALCRGTFRFVVKQVKQTIPFPIVVVDELLDDHVQDKPSPINTTSSIDDDTEEEEDDDDEYATLPPSELVRRTLQAIQTYVDQQLAITGGEDGDALAARQVLSPLEESILEEAGLPLAAQRQAAMETAAVWQVFQDYLVDLCPEPTDRYFTVAFMAAEMANLNNHVRRAMLRTTSGIDRLRTIVLPALEEVVGMARARQAVAREIEDSVGGQDLQVGTPTLPPWASQIKEGSRIEYFWNEDYGWCAGTVVAAPMWVVSEYVLTIRFDDGETHRLPFEADEKARWRPGPPKPS